MAEPVYLELGRRKVFACSLRWPGWCRWGADESAALAILEDYADRYAPVATRAGLRFPRPAGFEVLERLAGTGTTDFGAPGAVPEADRRDITKAEAARLAAIVQASWAELDKVAASSPAQLRKGPRGGGRDRDAMIAHVNDAEVAYGRKFGARVSAAEVRQAGPGLVRRCIAETLTAARHPPDPGSSGWPAPYAARRVAWHVLDHVWEMQDRSA